VCDKLFRIPYSSEYSYEGIKEVVYLYYLPFLAFQEVRRNGSCGLCCRWSVQGKALCHCGCHRPDQSMYDNDNTTLL
jgi:hypothetical protein